MSRKKNAYVAPEFATGSPRSNRARVQAVQQRRRSNAAGKHNSTPRQFRTRAAARRSAIEES